MDPLGVLPASGFRVAYFVGMVLRDLLLLYKDNVALHCC